MKKYWNKRKAFQICIIVLIILLFAGCQTGGGTDPNAAPYPVTGDDETPLVAEDTNPSYIAGTTNDQVYYLFIKQENGLDDPDNDAVFFRSDTLPDWMELDESTGELTILDTSTKPPGSTEVINFWSEDEHGADSSSASLEVTFSFSVS